MLSAALTVHFGPAAAEKAGLLKELADSEGKSGFSFIDLTADLSGIAFAEAVRNKKISVRQTGRRLSRRKIISPKSTTSRKTSPSRISKKTTARLEDERFKTNSIRLKARVKELPGLQPSQT